jgi:glucosamine kinase
MTGLGIDAGGTQTRWALANQGGAIFTQGAVGGLSATQINLAAGRDQLRQGFGAIAAACAVHAQPAAIHAALTGFDGSAPDAQALRGLLAQVFTLAADAISLSNDVEMAYRDVFAPGQGYLIYAGTGSIAVFVDAQDTPHRAGGRGHWLDDGGSGAWIAREALRAVWRIEDEAPDSWQHSLLAKTLFEHIGSPAWAASRQLILQGERGRIGALALAVAQAAQAGDTQALAILQAAGHELARLAQAMITRFGTRPVVLSGRAVTLHPCIAQIVQEQLPATISVDVREAHAHHAAARIAATRAQNLLVNP